jgi:hypothetical protein
VRGRHVKGRVLFEETDGLERETGRSTGMTGQSSGRGMWWLPSVYQSTMSVFSIERPALVH